MNKIEVVVATHNLHKLREIKEMCRMFDWVDLVSLRLFDEYTPPEETGKTFEENAVLKAEHFGKTFDKWVIADDSGLVVPALKGAPGVFSARYAGPAATDNENLQKLLKEMEFFDDMDRSAYYECVLALYNPIKGATKIVRGISEGQILKSPRGSNGFGYDPVFQKYEYEKTFGELDETTKNRVSHRRKAFDKLVPHIESIKISV